MPSTFESFQEANISNIQSDDFVVGYDTAVLGGERRYTIDTIANKSFQITNSQLQTQINNSIANSVAPNSETGFIKKFARMRPSNSALAAITTTNRVIAWGRANAGDSTEGGKLAVLFAADNRTPPNQYVRVPFHSYWSTYGGPAGDDYLDDNPSVEVIDLVWNNYGAMALLSDGTAWVAGFNNGGLGLGAGPNVNNIEPTCGFVKLTFGTGAQPFIKRIDAVSDNNSNNAIYSALDTTDTLWLWGKTDDGVFGTSSTTYTEDVNVPRKLGVMEIRKAGQSPESVNFEGQILKYEFNASETAAGALSIILKDNRLFISGDNTYGQRGTGDTTKDGRFSQAKKDANTFVDDAVNIEQAQYSGRQTHYYINTSGEVLAAGDNSNYGLGNGNQIDSTYFQKVTWPSGLIAKEIKVSSYHYPCVFVLCSQGGVDYLYSWGYNGENYGFCGVSSTANYVTTPTRCKVQSSNGARVDFTNIDKFYVSDQLGRKGVTGAINTSFAAVCVIDKDGYAYTCGYSNYNDPPEYTNVKAQWFVKVPLYKVKEVAMGTFNQSTNDIAWSAHRNNVFLLENGSTFGMGDVANGSYLFGVGSDTLKHPCRLI